MTLRVTLKEMKIIPFGFYFRSRRQDSEFRMFFEMITSVFKLLTSVY